tara:strand:+ start:91 stop:357 length:267 start_codon:yes stop_codon:yes gene_type:complete
MKPVMADVMMICGTGAQRIGAIPPVVMIVMEALCSNAFGVGKFIAMIVGTSSVCLFRVGHGKMFGFVMNVRTDNPIYYSYLQLIYYIS